MSGDLDLLITRYLEGIASQEELVLLSARLERDENARRELLRMAEQDLAIRELLAGAALAREAAPGEPDILPPSPHAASSGAPGPKEAAPAIPPASRGTPPAGIATAKPVIVRDARNLKVRQQSGFRKGAEPLQVRRPVVLRWAVIGLTACLLLALGLWQFSRPSGSGAAMALARIETVNANTTAGQPSALLIRGSENLPLEPGLAMQEGDQLDCRALPTGGSVTVSYADGTRLIATPGTVATFSTVSGSKTVDVAAGPMQGDVAHQPSGHPMLFRSPLGTATVLGTHLIVTLDERAFRLDVTEGRVRLQRQVDAAEVIVETGHYALAERTAAAPLTVRLLPPVNDKIKITQNFESLAEGSTPPEAASSDAAHWIVGVENGNHYVICTADKRAELPFGAVTGQDFTLDFRYRCQTAPAAMGVFARVKNDTDPAYCFQWSGAGVSILQGSPADRAHLQVLTTHAKAAILPNLWHTARVALHGDEMALWVDGNPILKVHDAKVAAGNCRLFVEKGEVWFDDVVLTPVAP